MIKNEIGIFSSPRARSEARVMRDKVWDLGAPLLFLTSPEELAATDHLPNKLISIGGEGTNGIVLNEVYRRGAQGEVIIGSIPVGTQNVANRELIEADHSIPTYDFIEIPFSEIQGKYPYKPGLVGQKRFNNQFADDSYTTLNGNINHALRMLGEKRVPLVRVLAAVAAAGSITNRSMLDIYTVTKRIGKALVAPDQELLGNEVSHLIVEGNTFQQRRKLMLTLLAWRKGIIPPDNILKVEKNGGFVHETKNTNAWIDGDTVDNPIGGSGVVARENEMIDLVALL